MDLAAATDVIDAAFDAFGIDGTYQAGEAEAVDCRFIPHRPSKDRSLAGFTVGDHRIADVALFILVRASEVADPAAHATFTITETGKTYRIGEDAPVAGDVHDITWRCAVALER